MGDFKINILHLYPDLLNLYGDKGNIECMRKRLKWRGVEASVKYHTMENPVDNFLEADIVLLGGGMDRELNIACERLKERKKELIDFVEDGGSLLAVCGGYQILGNTYQIGDKECDGLGILDISTKTPENGQRLIGDAVIECDGVKDKVVGFENHSGRTDIGELMPFGRVIKGFGNDGKSGFEGVSYKNLIGTYLHGPLLPKNPKICDKILLNALKRKYPDFTELSPLDDGIEVLANEYMLNRN